MGSVLQFIKNNLHSLLFLLLLSLSISILVSYHTYHRILFFNSATSWLASWSGLTQSTQHYFSLREMNNQLVNENIRLRKQLPQSQFATQTDTFAVEDTLLNQRYLYISAQVAGNTTDKAFNYITLNKGANHGLAEGMGVFGPQGVVGVIKKVSPNFSLVMSVLHEKNVVSPKVVDLNLSQGKVKWEGRNPDFAYLSGINRYENIEPGQTLVTSPYSINFPENIPIGTVESVQEVEGSFIKAKIQLATRFTQLRKVYVVVDLFKEELELLNSEKQEGL